MPARAEKDDGSIEVLLANERHRVATTGPRETCHAACMWLRARVGSERPLLVAHRAGAWLANGDPLEGVQRLVAMGAEMVEIDVRVTRDRVLVVHHDPTLDGVSIRETDYSALTAMGRGRLAPLEELLAVAAGRLAIDLELKEPGYEAAVLAALNRGADMERTVVSSACDAAIATFKRIEPNIATGLIVGSRPWIRRPYLLIRDILPFQRLAACRADFLAPARALLPTGLARRAESRGVPLLVWTVNDPGEIARYLADPRVLGVVTDSVELFAKGLGPDREVR
jgi:glycerophosphoryl diester phosphodiesterase